MSHLQAFEDVAEQRWIASEFPLDARWVAGQSLPWERERTNGWTVGWDDDELHNHPQLWGGALVTGEDVPLVAQVLELSNLDDGWNGPGSRGISITTGASAAMFALDVRAPEAVVSPTESGEILFEWELADDLSVFAHARDTVVAVTMFDGARTYVDLVFDPIRAAQLVTLLLDNES